MQQLIRMRVVYQREWPRIKGRSKKAKYDQQKIARPAYQGDLPEGNDGLGLLLLE